MNDRDLKTLLNQLAEVAASGAPPATLMPAILGAAPASIHAALRRALVDGEPLSSALATAGAVDIAERALIEAGERSGRVPETLRALAETISERQRARAKILVGLAYPAVLIVLAGFLLTAPIAVSRGVGAWLAIAVWPLVVVVAAAVVVFGVLPRLPKENALRTLPERMAARIPILGPGLARTGCGTFCDLLSQLVSAGVPLTLALPSAMRSWAQLAPHEVDVLRSISAGSTLTEALRLTQAIPERILRPLAAAEITGSIDTVLHVLAREETAAGRRFTLALAAAIGMLAFFLVAAGIAFTVVQGARGYIEQIDEITAE